jgi:ribosomal protein S18 acetylase RimI-like enzyme
VTYVADGDGHLFGFVCATVMPTHVLVERVAVDQAYRRVRVGTGLLDSLEHFFMPQQGSAAPQDRTVTAKRKQMQAVVNEWAVDQQLFLRACGWKWVKTVRWGREPEEYVMVKEFK